jgi:hypothetical protein
VRANIIVIKKNTNFYSFLTVIEKWSKIRKIEEEGKKNA